jgi:hypothetical protein
MIWNCSAVVTWTAPTASDIVVASTFVSTHNSGCCIPHVGTTTVRYTATDIHNNVTTTSFTVTINDSPPQLQIHLQNIPQNNDLGNCSAVVTWTAPMASDNCSIARSTRNLEMYL